MSKTYKTAAIAKTQATKQHGKNWEENWSILESEEGFEIVAKLPEQLPTPPEEVILSQIGDTGSSQVLADEIGMGDPTDEEIDESNAQQNCSFMSSLISNMLNPESVPQAPAASKKDAEKTGKTVEQNRPEQNGLKRPPLVALARLFGIPATGLQTKPITLVHLRICSTPCKVTTNALCGRNMLAGANLTASRAACRTSKSRPSSRQNGKMLSTH